MSNAKVRHRRRRRARITEQKKPVAQFQGRYDGYCGRKFFYEFKTTRTSSSKPNLITSLPPRTEFGRKLHEAIIMDQPSVLVNVDFAELERRMLRYGQANPDCQVSIYSGLMEGKLSDLADVLKKP